MLIHYLPKLIVDREPLLLPDHNFQSSDLVTGIVFVQVPSKKMPPNDVTFSDTAIFEEIDLEKRSSDFIDGRNCDFETAIHYCQLGKFQRVLLIISGIIYATCAISSTTLSFVLPSAGCDFGLTSTDKGKLTAMSLVGMLLGCSLWGSIADCHGRKVALILSLFMDFLSAVISSTAQTFNVFLVCRFFNGFGIIGATSIIFPYLGEFLPKNERDRYLGKLEIFWNLGVIVLPGVAWCFLSKNMFEHYTRTVAIAPWRIFVLVCSLPSLISFALICFFPETPKYLIDDGQYDKAKDVFQKIYVFNTGRSAESYPVTHLDGERSIPTAAASEIKKKPARHYIKNSLSNAIRRLKNLANQQYLKYLIITCFVDFGLMASYYTLVLWFPELFERFNEYESRHPNRTAGICAVSHVHISQALISYDCDSSIGNAVFLETLVLGVTCLPTSASLSYFMRKFGKKFVLVFGLVLSGMSTLSLNLVQNSTQTLIVSSVFEALTSILEAVLLCVVVDLFPTNLRALALSVTVTCGRMGAIFGNIIFGSLLDLNCVIPIYVFGLLLIASGVLCFAIPKHDNYIPIL